MKRLFAAIAFLTRAPLPSHWQFDAADVGRASLMFPLVGAGLGVVSLAVMSIFRLHIPHGGQPWWGPLWLPSPVVAVLIVAVSARLTGALHLDGLADMADGFGGGHTREDVLRIMRDHVIGAYGAVALILLILLKVAALSALINADGGATYLIIAPVLGRWASTPLGYFLPYARREGGLGVAVTNHVGRFELIGSTALTAVCVLPLAGWRGEVCWLAAILVTSITGRMCMRRIGGVTGDTLGANTEVCEAAVLLVGIAFKG
jgi:adenosylcobinamide-GDP ribazoletransferase